MVGTILRRHGLTLAPKRKQVISWKDFIRSHMEVLVDGYLHRGSPYPERVGYLLCPVFHSLGESAGELGRNDALPGP